MQHLSIVNSSLDLLWSDWFVVFVWCFVFFWGVFFWGGGGFTFSIYEMKLMLLLINGGGTGLGNTFL